MAVNSPTTVTPLSPNITSPALTGEQIKENKKKGEAVSGNEVQCESSICRDCRGDCDGCDKCPLCKIIQNTCDKGEKKLKLGYDMIFIEEL